LSKGFWGGGGAQFFAVLSRAMPRPDSPVSSAIGTVEELRRSFRPICAVHVYGLPDWAKMIKIGCSANKKNEDERNQKKGAKQQMKYKLKRRTDGEKKKKGKEKKQKS
jgi:hypothetical protein